MPLDESAENEIRRFEEQFRRQPDSLVFARLADAYRKAGDAHRALAVLEEGIRRHTDYLSAHIVLARTYWDLGRFEDARSAFERVIEIDAENLVAIQGLAEIARGADDTVAEIAWLERLTLADPQDPEPGARLEELRRLADRVHVIEPGSDRQEGQESTAEDETWWSEESAVEAESQAAANPPADSGLGSELWSGPAITPDHESEESLEPAREMEGESVEASAAGPAEEWDDPEEWENTAEVLTDPFEDPEADPFQEVELDNVAPGGSPTAEPAARDAWWFEPPADESPTGSAGEANDDSNSDDDADLLTRTMAELYARQGLIDEAEAIYRELLRDRPDDESLRDGLDAVLGMRAARVASRTPDIAPDAVEIEVEAPESLAEPVGPGSVSAADDLTALLRAGEALVHRLPEPPSSPADDQSVESELEGADSAEPEPVDESPDARPVLEEWLRGLRG